ncbi:hydrogenase maturation nickel metallochaperone HypA [Granulicella sp. dw_53]|uniref:hydrogenase maturation nickel metallochaperone HypA/HybF n=1 Tax=Granulicella sp. dw_53 TaxID=2719792 RepID=UPI001BD3973D|nr:hydrogenase maturation nickel metallochaperone HypA [Granulicella sp. dw_53]
MHELSIAISMIDQIQEESESRGGLTVKAVHLSLGLLSGVDKDALQFCYKAACQGTFLEGSQLVIEVVPIVLYCPACLTESRPVSIQQLACPECRTAGRVIRGHELEVASLEVAA